MARVAHSGESAQGDGATLAGGEKENLIPPMLLVGLTTTATKSKKNARTLADTKLEMEVISQCGFGGLDHYKPSRTNMARMKLEGQLDVVEYSRITVPDSVHVGHPSGDAVGEEFRERAPDGLEREASHAGVSGGADGELLLK